METTPGNLRNSIDYFEVSAIFQKFEQQVYQFPDKVAVAFEHTSLTYQELNNRANQLARYLQELGVGTETLVGICVERSLEMVVGLLGILKAGGAYIPLDPAYPADRLDFMLEDAEISVLLTQAALVDGLPHDTAQVVCLDTNWHEIARYDTRNLETVITADQLAYIIYTSGSTGKPKGVQIQHGSVINFLRSMERQPGISAQDILLAVTTLSFDIAVLELFLPLSVGARIVIASREAASDGMQLSTLLTSSGATIMQATPASWRMLLKAGWQGDPCLKILCGGEALPRELANQLLQRSGSVWNLYGPTETTVWSLVYQVGVGTGSIPIGQPIANTQIYLLDPQLQPVAPGEMGELHIGGDGLARGYLHRPELTQERFIPNPFAEERKWTIRSGEPVLCPPPLLYKTGDLARLMPDGNLEYLGRIDHQVKLRGFRIELGEIEAALWQHPDIHEVAVVVREDVPDDRRLVAYVVWQAEQKQPLELSQTQSANLRQFLQQTLPEYMLPSHFVFLEKLPLTPNGKIDRRALPVPQYTRCETDCFIAPRTAVEQTLSEIWTEVLGVNPISINDQFLELGGHSLLATQITSRIRDALQVELPLRDLFELGTIAGLAERIETAHFKPPATQTTNIQLLLQPRQEEYSNPLSFMQEQLWFLDQLVPNHPFYNVPEAVRLDGRLQVDLLEQSLQVIIHRHEALRTTFAVCDERPVPIVHATSDPHCAIHITVIDLQHLSAKEQSLQVPRYLTKAARQPFDLMNDLLIRATLIQLSEEQHILLLNLHHIICDEWSFSILWREMAILYAARVQGQSAVLSPPAIQYADFAFWQRQSQAATLEHSLSYWKQQLAGLSVLQLPTDYPRSPVPTYQGARHFFSLPEALTQNLKDLGRQAGATPFMTLLAAFQTLLFRYTAQTNLAVGSPIANRHCSEVEGTIGFFVNTLVFRTDLSDVSSFRDLLRRVRQVALDAYAHQDLPFEQLVQALQPDRTLNHNPLFQVMFNLQNIPVTATEIPDLAMSRLPVDNKTAKFDLFLELTETEQGFSGYFEYSTDLFRQETIDRMVEQFQILLEGIVTDPDCALSKLPLLTQAEQQQLAQWNATESEYPQQCVHRLFEAQVERTPDAIALVFEHQQLTYRELNHRANRVAHHLQSLGVGPDVAVGLCVERSFDLIVGLLGILKAGGAYLPLDPIYPQERLAFMLENAQAALLLTQQSLVNSFAETNIHSICLDVDWETIANQSIENPQSNVTSDHLAYIIYTSGSTGKPKGVAMPHRPLSNLLHWQIHNSVLSNGTRTLQFAPISFDVSFQESFATLTSGGTLVLIPDDVRRDAVQLLHVLKNEAIERLFLPFVALQHLAEVAETENIVPTALREVITAGEQLRITQPIANWFNQLNDCTLHNHYGPSESHVVTAFTLTGSPETWPALPAIGRPIANTQIHLLDAQLQPVPMGVPGELYIGGDSLARGYVNRDDLTQERFINHLLGGMSKWRISNGKPVLSPAQTRLYKTGDLARYLPDGNLEYLGRVDQQVKIRGFRIEPGEVEAVLEQHPAVREAVVIVREDLPGRKQLVGYIVTAENLSNAELRQFSQARLPEYMVPATFVLLDALPLTPSGKVDRRSLPIPDYCGVDAARTVILPRTEVEQALAELWTQVLKVEPVGIHDNFFELGGHSLLGTQLVIKIRAAFAVELTLRQFFEAPTIAELAQVIGSSQPATSANPTTAASTASHSIDLQAETLLDPTIHTNGLSYAPLDEPAAIFLTGATGFLGAYLLSDLLQQTQADLYCLVRAASVEQGYQRIQNNLERYGLWNGGIRSRLIPVIGDLSKPRFNLSSDQFQALGRTVDVIYHNGGLVNFLYPYSVLKAANVLGSQEVLRLASLTKIKPVHFISTVGVFSPADYTDVPVVREQDVPDRTAGLYGYTQSKWVAEKLMMAARSIGIPTSIYRPFWVEGHSQTGVCNGTDFLRSLIKGCIQLGVAPDWNMRVDMLPVDYLSQAIVHLSMQSHALNQSFHFSNSAALSWNELVHWLRQYGYPLQQISYESWVKEIIHLDDRSLSNALYPFIPYFAERMPTNQMSVPDLYFHAKPLLFDCQNVVNGLANSNIVCPAVDEQLLNTYFSYLISSNFLNAPS